MDIREMNGPARAAGQLRSEVTSRQFADLVRNAAEGTVVVDGEGVVLFANPAAEILLGRGAGGAVGFTLGYPVVGDEPTIIKLLRPGSDPVTVEMGAAEIFWDAGQAFVVNLHDVTERLRDEEELREVSRRLRAHISAGQVGLWEWDLDTNRTIYSTEWKRQIGYDEDELANDIEEWRRRVHPEDLKETLATIKGAIASGEMLYKARFRFRHKDGTYRSILAQASILRGEDDGSVRVVGSHVDLTELRQAEHRQQEAEAQLRQAQKMESVGMLAGGVAHDFNNVLAVILGVSELSLMDEDLSEPQRADLEEIHEAGTRAANLTRQLLGFARQQTIEPQAVNLNETVVSMSTMLSRVIGEDLELILKPGYELWSVKMDPAQIDQLLTNLVLNARDAIQERSAYGGRITLETENVEIDKAFCDRHPGMLPGQYVELAVSDNGAGMDEATRAKVFDPFFTTKPLGEGTGLGLATVYGIVKQNEGFVIVNSEPGEGTAMRVYLPRLVDPEAKVRAPTKATETIGGTETLLIVEDDVSVLGVAARVLEKLGYDVLVTNSPENALKLVRDRGETIDLVISDVVMPGMNGRELSEAVRALRPEMRCLFFSGYPRDVVTRRGVLLEGTPFLEKPFNAGRVATAVRLALDDSEVR